MMLGLGRVAFVCPSGADSVLSWVWPFCRIALCRAIPCTVKGGCKISNALEGGGMSLIPVAVLF